MADFIERIRDWLQEHPRFAVGLSGVSVLILTIVVVSLQCRGEQAQVVVFEQEWYYDLNTQTLFTAAKGQTPPIDAPSGPMANGEKAGVRAYVLTFEIDPNESEQILAFIETSDPAVPDATDKGPSQRWGTGKLIRRIEDPEWVSATSTQGRRIVQEAFKPDEHGEKPYYFYPR